jgi:uncharacterized protein YyaL (SSP411 family)
MTWGDAAFARAKEEQKPIFLAVGIFTSELSRAMARQTFSNTETAAFLNETFVCVLVDAKEQPQLAALYQNYIQTVKQLRGMPLNIWLTPELKPFDGANYLPPTEEWGKEGFLTVAKRAAAGWKADPAAQRAKAEEAVSTVIAAQPTTVSEITDEEIETIVRESREAWRARFDATNGGFNESPKYPEPELLRWLLLDPTTQEMALTTLRSMLKNALHDPLDGGFFRSTIDAEWKYPYFQKTLADQARLALALLDASRISGDPQFGEAARSAIGYVLTQLRLPDGDFAAAEDATPDTLAESYLWTFSELREVLGEGPAKEFASVYGVTAEGNIPADTLSGITTTEKNILRLTAPTIDAATEKSLQNSREKLRAKRQQRPAPRREDNATSGAHGLLLQAFTRAGVQLNDATLLAAAKDELAFIRERLVLPGGTLRRVAGRASSGAPEDYAFVISGVKEFAVYSKNGDVEPLRSSLVSAVNAEYWDDAAGRYVVVGRASLPTFWARVVSPSPLPADLPSAEATLLAIFQGDSKMQDATAGQATALRRAVAIQARDSDEVARGDLLLGLSAAAK